MPEVFALIPKIAADQDNGGVTQLTPAVGNCPSECVFLQMHEHARFCCALAYSLQHGLNEILAQPHLLQDYHRWPGPPELMLTCPAGIGFDGRRIYIDPAAIS